VIGPETRLPEAKAVRDLLIGTAGRDVSLTVDGEGLDPDAPGGAVVAEYVTDLGHSVALIALDLPLAAHLGAALGLVPPAVSQEAVRDGYLSDDLLDNAYEVLNIAGSLFNVGDAPHVRLIEGLYDTSSAPLPAEIDRWLRGYVPRLDAACEVRGYGAGRLSVLLR
jgi:hypothetical protein